MSRTLNSDGKAATALSASWIGSDAQKRLQGPTRAYVHSAFDGAVNIVTRKGLVSIVPSRAGRSPTNIVLDAGGGVLPGVCAGDQVSFDGTALTISGRYVLSLSESRVYDPPIRFEKSPLRGGALKNNLGVARLTIITHGRLAGMGYLANVVNHPGRKSISQGPLSVTQRTLRGATRLLKAIELGDAADAARATGGLAGLGIGLTPSSDDFLSGLMATLVLGGRNGAIDGSNVKLAAAILAATRGRTTMLSQDQLDQASKGRGSEWLTSAIESVYTGGEAEVATAIRTLLLVGHTSGTDAATGIYSGLMAAVENDGGDAR